MPYVRQHALMLQLAQSYQLLSDRDGNFDRTAFDREYGASIVWAHREYCPPQPLTAIWEDFIYHRAEESTWEYLFGRHSQYRMVFPGILPPDPRREPPRQHQAPAPPRALATIAEGMAYVSLSDNAPSSSQLHPQGTQLRAQPLQPHAAISPVVPALGSRTLADSCWAPGGQNDRLEELQRKQAEISQQIAIASQPARATVANTPTSTTGPTAPATGNVAPANYSQAAASGQPASRIDIGVEVSAESKRKRRLQNLVSLSPLPTAAEFAAGFHNGIYRPQATRNEPDQGGRVGGRRRGGRGASSNEARVNPQAIDAPTGQVQLYLAQRGHSTHHRSQRNGNAARRARAADPGWQREQERWSASISDDDRRTAIIEFAHRDGKSSVNLSVNVDRGRPSTRTRHLVDQLIIDRRLNVEPAVILSALTDTSAAPVWRGSNSNLSNEPRIYFLFWIWLHMPPRRIFEFNSATITDALILLYFQELNNALPTAQRLSQDQIRGVNMLDMRWSLALLGSLDHEDRLGDSARQVATASQTNEASGSGRNAGGEGGDGGVAATQPNQTPPQQ